MSGQGETLGLWAKLCFSDPGWTGLHVARSLPWLRPRGRGLPGEEERDAPILWETVEYSSWWVFHLLSSIALDPLYPSRCSWETFGYATSTTMAQASDGLSPLQLSGQLNSLPCSLTFRQEETISIIRLIEQVGLGGYWGWLCGQNMIVLGPPDLMLPACLACVGGICLCPFLIRASWARGS